MESVQPKYSKEEFARRGKEIFEQQVAEKVKGIDPDKILAIDIDTGDFEVGDEILETVRRLRERKPEAQPLIRRVGSRPVMRFGGARS